MSGARQLALGLGHRPSLGGDDFLVASGNRDAVAWLDRWPDWPGPALAIHGPAGCGKTHLAHVFLARTAGTAIAADGLAGAGEAAAARLGDAPACVVDDAERAVEAGGERALLHLHNVVHETGRRMLLLARTPPARWRVGLADLRSRLKAATAVAIGPPDDALIRAVLAKQFADRQLAVDDGVVDFLILRIERSFERARAVVAEIDDAALRAHRRVTVPLARDVLQASEDSGRTAPASGSARGR